LKDAGKSAQNSLSFDAEYEGLLDAADPRHDFPEFDENTRATTFYTTGTTAQPKGVYSKAKK